MTFIARPLRVCWCVGMGRARWAAVAAATACLLGAAPAHAQTTIDAPDMEIDVGAAGELGADFNTDGAGQVLPFDSAGLQIDVGGTATGIGEFTAGTQGAVTGTGTGTDPYTVTTTFSATGLQVTEKVTHANGDPSIGIELTLQNPSTTDSVTVRPIEWGEVAGGGFAEGTGAVSGAPPHRYVTGRFPTTASVSGLREITPWAHYEEADDADLTQQLTDPAANLNDSVAAAPHDPAVAAQFPDQTLAPGASTTLAIAWSFVPGAAHIDLQPGDGAGPLDQPACFTATVTDVYGTPVTTPIEFSAGDPHPDLDTTTDAAGHAAYCANAAEPGEELFVDASVPDALLDAFSTWTFAGGGDGANGGGAPPTPVAGSRLTARRVTGKVRLRHGTRYTTLTGSKSIKVGSTLDARHGTVELTALVGRHRQTARFGAGIFRIHQASASAPVALALAGAPFGPACKTRSHKVVRRLRATADRGRWQTVGRRSVTGVAKAASWITQDRCDGTLTVVRAGTVTVRGAHGRTFTVRAGHRRLIRARSG